MGIITKTKSEMKSAERRIMGLSVKEEKHTIILTGELQDSYIVTQMTLRFGRSLPRRVMRTYVHFLRYKASPKHRKEYSEKISRPAQCHHGRYNFDDRE